MSTAKPPVRAHLDGELRSVQVLEVAMRVISHDAAAVASIAGLGGQERHGELSMDELLEVLRAIVVRNSTQPDFVRLYFLLSAEALNPSHPARQYFVDREAATLDAFARMVGPHVAAPLATARQLLAFMSGLEEQWLRADHGFDLVAEWDRGVAQLLPAA